MRIKTRDALIFVIAETLAHPVALDKLPEHVLPGGVGCQPIVASVFPLCYAVRV